MYRFYRYKKERKHYDPNKKFYVCSYGGCGSQMLCHYLGNFGDVYHLHSRHPPEKLTNTGYDDEKTYSEWFSSSEIPESELHKYNVIFLYRNPIDVIYSRYIDSPDMLKNVQCSDVNISVEYCMREGKDLFELEDFFNNYTTKSVKNYPIYCVKYEDLFENIPLFNETFALPNIPSLFPERKEKEKKIQAPKELVEIYQPFTEKLKQMTFIEKR
jgi:hypothetical protein